VRTPVGIKVFGDDLAGIERVGTGIEAALRKVPGTRSVFAERTAGGYFVDFELNRDALARYGLAVADANAVVMSAIGGEVVRPPSRGGPATVNVRYPRDCAGTSRLGRISSGPGRARPSGQVAARGSRARR
jgi:Cu(I)/Ag(I) efflux system membrane protein CusA/SilA